MKRVICFAVITVMMFGMFPVYTTAAETDMKTDYFDDGSYMTIELITHGSRASGSVTGSKKSTYYGGDGSTAWVATLTGTFSYTGSSATCTSSNMDITIYVSAWYTISKSATKSSNTANGNATVGLKNAGITVSRVPVTLTIACDANGNLT